MPIHSPYHSNCFPLLFLFLLILSSCQVQISQITMSNSSIGATGVTYSMTFFRFPNNAVPINSSLTLTFNPAFNLQSPICKTSDFGITDQILSCSALNNILTINQLFSSPYSLTLQTWQLSVQNITNPIPAKTYTSITNITIMSGSSTIDQGTNVPSTTITPLPAICTYTINNNIVFSRGQITITYTSSMISGTTNTNYYMNAITNLYYPSDQTQTSISPQFIPQPIFFNNLGNNEALYQLPYTTTINVAILMPPSDQPINNVVTLNTYQYAQDGYVDYCSVNISGIRPNVLNMLSVGQQIVQRVAGIGFNMQLSTPLTPTDSLKITFPATFNLNSTTASTLNVVSFNPFKLTKQGNLLTLTPNLTSSILYATLLFTIPNILLPFTTTPTSLTIALITSQGYYRINQTYTYIPLSGTASLSINCNSYEIGVTTICTFTITTVSQLMSDGIISIKLPNSFPQPYNSTTCQITATGLLSSTVCTYNSVNNIISTSTITSTTDNIPAMTIVMKSSIVMSQQIGVQNITVNTISQNSIVDTGVATITAGKRKLTRTELNITSTSSTTNTPTTYSISLALPFDSYTTYTIAIYIPVTTRTGQPLSLTNADLISFTNNTITANTTSSTTISITGLMTPISTEPLPISITITYTNLTLFYSNIDLTMTILTIFNIISLTQSNNIVYTPFIATITLSGLSIGDHIAFLSNYTQFYGNNQSICVNNSGIICDNINKIVQVNNVDNVGIGLTSVQIVFVNFGNLGSYNVNITSYDSNNVYAKQTGIVTVITDGIGTMAVQVNRSNPFLNQTDIYTFRLTFSTPGATQLKVSTTNIPINNAICQLNCLPPTLNTSIYTFPLTTTLTTTISLNVTNPISYSSSTIFTFITSNNQNSQDRGQYQPLLQCALPCRSCQTVNDSQLCLSCYIWKNQKYFYDGSCYGSCPNNTYIDGYNCMICAQHCTSCYNYTVCSSCINNYKLYYTTCVNTCPSYTLSTATTCTNCSSPCASCTSTTTTCTSCIDTYSLLNNTCYLQCPSTYYKSLTQPLCIPCNTTCLQCTALACLSCPPSSYLYQGTCHFICPNGSFAVNSTHCSQCPPQCSSCTAGSTCITCISTHLLLNASCFDNCPVYYYADNRQCSVCVTPCKQCNSSTYCLSCINPTLYLSQGNCVTNCSSPLHPNNTTMLCQPCISPCLQCTYSTICLTCITNYLLHQNTCLPTCPTGYYNQNSICVKCPQNCTSCSYVNLQPACSSCITPQLIYSYGCVLNCPINYTQQGLFCANGQCGNLSNCLLCSGFRCLQCHALYTLGNDYACNQVKTTNQVLAALSSVPIPFPFLIAIIMIIIISFFLKHSFSKMYSPLFIYALAGCLQALALAMWTTLTILWNLNIVEPYPLVSVVYATVVVVAGYVVMNLVGFLCFCCVIAKDKKYRQWQQQDNKCSSYTITLLSLIFSFRLNCLKYSKTGHSPHLSARLSTPTLFLPHHILALTSILLSSFTILISVYLTTFQTELNYLFFSCLEVAIISIIMIVMSIIMLCVPKEQVLENKDEYKYGKDQDVYDGPSLQEMLEGVQEEEYHQGGIESESGHAVMRQRQANSSQSDNCSLMQDITLEAPIKLQFKDQANQMLDRPEGFQFQDQVGQEATLPYKTIRNKTGINMDSHLFGTFQFGDNTLIDEMSVNKANVIALAEKYLLQQTQSKPLFTQQAKKQDQEELQSMPQYEELSQKSNFGEYQQYVLDHNTGKWHQQPKKTQEKGLKGEQTEEQWIIDVRKKMEQDMKKQKKQKAARQIQKIVKLKQMLKLINEQTKGLQKLDEQLTEQQKDISRKERQRRQRTLMGIQDQLSRATIVFEDMKKVGRPGQLRPPGTKKIRKESRNSTYRQGNQVQFEYINNEMQNLLDQPSPRKIKVKSKPDPAQYKRQHIYVEEGGQMYESAPESAEEELQEDLKIVFDTVGIEEEKKVEKPRGIKRRQTAKKRKDNPNPVVIPTQRMKTNHSKNKSKSKSKNKQKQQKIANPVPIEQPSAQLSKTPLVQNPPSQQERRYELSQIMPSELSHWPVEPQLQDKITQLEQRANQYLQRPKNKQEQQQISDTKRYISEMPSEQIYIQEDEGDLQSDQKTVNQIVFQESDKIVPVQQLMRSNTKKRFRDHRVNRRVIDLNPHK